MAKYYRSGNKHQVTIGEFTFQVDSNLEEKVIRHLHSHGFKEHWRPGRSIEHWSYNYTPDLELSVHHKNKTQRAIVEIKPSKAYYKASIGKRMSGVRKYYGDALLLLYAAKEKMWYEVDPDHYFLRAFGQPAVGKHPIATLPEPVSIKGRKKFDKQYRKKLSIWVALAELIKPFTDSKKKKRRRKR